MRNCILLTSDERLPSELSYGYSAGISSHPSYSRIVETHGFIRGKRATIRPNQFYQIIVLNRGSRTTPKRNSGTSLRRQAPNRGLEDPFPPTDSDGHAEIEASHVKAGVFARG